MDASGLLTTVANGTATITATAGESSGSATVTVAQVVSSVTVAPTEANFAALNDTLRLTAEALDANGHAVAGAELSWGTSDDSVAAVDASGLLTTVANGTATITATAGESSGSAAVTVEQVVSSVTVAPAEANFAALSDTLRLTAEAFDANGHAVAGAELSWGTSDDAVATVDATGLVTATANGTATITATAGEASGSAAVTVAQVVSSVTVAPAEANFAALGDTLRLTAEAFDANGHAVAGAEFSWESSDSAVATVDASGLVTTMARGSVTITATSGSVSGSAIVSVAQVVRAVAVTPDTATVVEGDTLRIAATATDANGQALAEVQFAWASGDTAVAVVDASGLVTGVGTGQAEVAATAAGVTGRTQLTVLAPVPTTIAVTPDTVVLTALGHSTQLTAEVRDQTGRAMEGVPVAWSSADTTIAVVDPAGLVRAVRGGAVTVTATAGDASGSAHVAVRQSAGLLTVSPPMDTIGPGDTLRLVAEAYDENGHVVAGAVFMWSSSDAPVATVDPSGLVRGAGEGTATITATAGDVSGTSEITVVNPDRVALVALYNATDGPNWVDNTNWLTDAPLGEWYGVSTDRQGRVVRLHLSGRWDGRALESTPHGLSGAIPPELGSLSRLEQLYLDQNALSGSIPPELGGLSNLVRLNLYRNELSGEIPPELGSLSNLEGLTLGLNALSGEIPPELGSLRNLVGLHLGSNGLSGEIPPELGNLANLKGLTLFGNGLLGAIPPELGGLSNLEDLFLSQNDLSGPIPPGLGGLEELNRLWLAYNNLSGAIPPELGDLSNLRDLGLHSNDLSGPIPPGLGGLEELRWLYLWDNDLTGEIPPELGGLPNLVRLYLGNNDLSGPIPPELGNLAELTDLSLQRNELSGPIPPSFLQLNALEGFWIGENEGLCVPGISGFVAWLRGIERQDESESLCNAADLAALESLYLATDGAQWTESGGWLGDVGVDAWSGVTADSLGHVTQLDLSRNGLAGRLPATLGELVHMTEFRIADNADLSGRLPLALAGLSLRALHYAGTGLCAPSDASFQTWLAGIPSHEGNGEECAPLTDREILEIFYDVTNGPNWTNNANWLTNAPLRNWYGVEVDGDGRVSSLGIYRNNLTGAIPPELGKLAELRELVLSGNLTGQIPRELGDLTALTDLGLFATNLTGSIPPELGNLARLEHLRLIENNLTGSIPPELGNLTALTNLNLYDNNLTGLIPPELGNLAELRFLNLVGNNLTGTIPPELGNLAKLTRLHVDENNLTGPIPPELGNLTNLSALSLASNDLSGSVPSELGTLTRVRWLSLANNAGLTGPLPQSLTGLDILTLLAHGTGLCAPTDAVFQAWLDRAYKRRIAPCVAGALPTAYLTQAVQSRDFPVPLVAGEKALLRVFPTARQATSEGIPLVRARFFVGGRETHVRDIPGKSDPIPTEVVEDGLSRSANAEIADWVIQPGLEMVIEVDPDATLDPELGVATRIPETGRLAVEVKAMPPLDLTVIPFVWTETHDSSIVDLVGAMAADPDHHEMLGDARTLLPIGALAVTAHEPVLSSSNNVFTLAAQTGAIRVMEGGSGHYMGMMSPPVTGGFSGLANGTRVNFSVPSPGLIAHELGHNMSLAHAPCGGAGGPDPSYPYSDGSIGAWGYDFRDSGRLVHPSTLDLMSYCGPQWISDYHFTNALRFRLYNEGSAAAAVSASAPSLLLWGGTGADSVPYLEPTFVIDAPAALPDSTGDYGITGRTAAGAELFSLSFTLPVTADGDGGSSFAFALPVRAGWENSLATITLSGPKGSVTLDGDSDIPMAIVRDPRTGEVRGILRDPPTETEAAADAAETLAPGLEVLFSRGIPGSAAWRR